MKTRKIRNIIPEFSLILMMAAIMILAYFFNDIVKYIGMAELEINLLHQNRVESNRDFIGMVAKYKLHKKLYENKISQHDFNLKEVKTNYLMTIKDSTGPVGIKKYKTLSPPALFLINGLRFTLGLPSIHLNTISPTSGYLDVAYYFERNKAYTKALQVYDKALKKVSRNDLQYPIIVLHQGFCNSIIGNYDQAKAKYSYVISEYKNQKIADTAAVLLSYIEDFEEEIKKVKTSEADSVEKSEKLFKLIAYDEALKTLDRVVPVNKAESEKIQFYKARSNEELGNTVESVELYQGIIDEDPASEYSKLSNRRILSISTTSDVDSEEIQKAADENNEKIKDPEFESYKSEINKVNAAKPSESLAELVEDAQLDEELSTFVEETLVVEKQEKDEIVRIIAEPAEDETSVTPGETENGGTNLTVETSDLTSDAEEVSESDATADTDMGESPAVLEEAAAEDVTADTVETHTEEIRTEPEVDLEKERLLARTNQLEVDKQWLFRQKYLLENRIYRMRDENNRQVTSLQNEQASLKSELEKMELLKKSLEEQLKNQRADSDSTSDKELELINQLALMSENKQQLEKEQAELKRQLENLSLAAESEKELLDKLDRMSESKQQLEDELASLKEQLEKQQAAENADNELEQKLLEMNENNEQLESKVTELQKLIETYQAEDDKKKRNTTETVTTKDQFKRTISKVTYKWDAEGVQSIVEYSLYYYLRDGKLHQIMMYDGEHKLLSYYIIEYDEAGRQTKIIQYDPDGKVLVK